MATEEVGVQFSQFECWEAIRATSRTFVKDICVHVFQLRALRGKLPQNRIPLSVRVRKDRLGILTLISKPSFHFRKARSVVMHVQAKNESPFETPV